MIDTIKKYAYILDKKQKRKIVFLFLVTCISATLEVMGVSLILPLIRTIMDPNIIQENSLIASLCNIVGIKDFKHFVLLCIWSLIGVYVFKNLFLIFQIYIQNKFVCNNRLAMQQRLMSAFLNKPYEYYLNASSGEIVRIVQGDAGQAFGMLMTLLSMSSEIVVSIALLATTFIIDPILIALVAVVLLLLAILIIVIVKPIMRRAGVEFQKNVAITNKWLLQAIEGIKETKVTQKEDFFAEKYRESGSKLVKAEKINVVIGQIPRLLIEMFAVCAMLIAVAIQIIGGREVQTLIPSLGVFAMAAVKLMPSANRIVTAFNSVAYNKPALDSLIKQLKELELYENEKNKAECSKTDNPQLTIEKEIEMRGITYSYPNADRNVLEDSRMVVPAGSSVGIVGTSGAGKTTAVDILLGLLKPQCGQVLSDGVDVSIHYDEWLSKIGYIPQMIFMLDGTIRDNVAFGVLKDKIDDKFVWRALEEAQLADYVRTLPDGLDTTIGERGVRISGGQRQRIGIARALYNNPSLLVFDEATSALDNETESAIMDSINSLHGKKTMIIIAHRLQTISGCDIVYRVADGKIVNQKAD